MAQASDVPSTLLGLLAERAARDPDGEAMRHLRGDKVVSTTWAEWRRRSRAYAAAFVAAGLQPGERVAILSHTRPEWAWLDHAILMAGGVTVPIFPTETSAAVGAVLADSGARFAVVEDPVQARKVAQVRDGLFDLRRLFWIDREGSDREGTIVTMDDVDPGGTGGRDPFFSSLEALQTEGETHLDALSDEVERRAREVRPNDLATLTYTPGTEGQPKGVMLTHRNFTATASALVSALAVGAEDVQVLYLPLAQAFARTSLTVAMTAGAVTAFARSHRTVLEDCRTFRPTFLCGVPRLFEKVRAGLDAERRDLPAVQRFALAQALELAAKARDGKDVGGIFKGVRDNLAERFVFGPMRRVFGGRLRFAISGGAPLAVETSTFFRQHGLEILEGYGMTETCACTAMSRLESNRPGTVGLPLRSVQVKVLPDGELCVRGPGVTPGIWNDPTGAPFDEDGWLRTGDLVRIDEDGFLVITDRKRDVIITANGKAIAPQPIAELLRQDPLVGEILIHGDGRSYLTALITLDREGLVRYAREEGLEGDYETLTRDPRVFAAIEARVEAVNARLASHETIRKFAILHSELSPDEGEVTPTRRVRRRVTTERHRALLDSFYSERY